jgi:hypothetical protein
MTSFRRMLTPRLAYPLTGDTSHLRERSFSYGSWSHILQLREAAENLWRLIFDGGELDVLESNIS